MSEQDEDRSPRPAIQPPPLPKPLSPPLPYLNYSNRPPPPSEDHPVMEFGLGIAGMALYFSLLIAMKAAAIHWRWDIGAICGTWVALLVFSFGLAGWLYGTFNWRGVMVGVFLAAVISLLAAPLVLGG